MRIRRVGHSFFRIISPKGKVIVVDPWIAGNPTCPKEWREPGKWTDVDVVLLTHGHFDHTAGLNEICRASSKVQVIAIYELALSLKFKGRKNVLAINKSGTIMLDGIRYTAVNAAHTSSFSELEKGKTEYLGTAVGYVITFENGLKVYIAGDTGLTADMRFVVGDFFKPAVAILPVDGVLCMDPEQAVYATKQIGCKYVIPCHDFPNPDDAPDKEGMSTFIKQFPFVQYLIEKSEEFAELMKREDKVKTVILKPGESTEIG